jgi:hypothetical protein
MSRLSDELLTQPLAQGQAVLALTFMHGARQRLDQRLRVLPGLRGKYECMTLDGFARVLRERWRVLAAALGQPPTSAVDFDQQCKLAADLIERKVVLDWVFAGYPLVVLDESQDLDAARLRLVQSLSTKARVLFAFDDFQCLDREMRPSPAARWLPTVCDVETLTRPRRTDVPALLDATSAIRSAQPPAEGSGFKIVACASEHQAAAFLATALRFPNGAKSIAVITPALVGGYAAKLVNAVTSRPCGTKQYGPFPLPWESHDSLSMEEVELLKLDDFHTPAELVNVLAAAPESKLTQSLARWARRQVDVSGIERLSRQDVLDATRRIISLHRSRSHRSDTGRRALTVHQAKNREFDGVVVVWPYQVGGDDEAKRRLLYNAVTRAKLWCKVVTQGEGALKKAPFA